MIFACMYYNGLVESNKISDLKTDGKGYDSFRTGTFNGFVDGEWKTFKGSPLSNGFFQFDLWKQEADYLRSEGKLREKIYNSESDKPCDPEEWGQTGTWDELRQKIIKYGVYNSMLLAPMPTASSAQMLRNAETTEAHQTLLYSRKLAHGNYTCFSEPFIQDMVEHKLWNQTSIDFIMMDNGSIKNFEKVMLEYSDRYPTEYFNTDKTDLSDEFKLLLDHLKMKHRGMYEISQKVCMRMARERGIYIDQSQSMNIYLPEPDKRKLKAVHDYGESLRLKTGMYYLRANPSSQTNRFTVDIELQEFHAKLNKKKTKKRQVVCTEEVCTMCQ